MLFEFLQHSYLIGIVLALLVLSILGQIIIGILYQKMIQETDNMAMTENKILKKCKLKFSNCYELNEGSVNIPVFVDKFMNQMKFAGMRVTNMTHVSGQLLLLSIFAAGVGACIGIINGAELTELLPYYIVSLFGLYLYFSISSLVDVKGKKYMVRTNLIDYLENHLVKRLQLVKEEEMQQFLVDRAGISAENGAEEKETREMTENKIETDRKPENGTEGQSAGENPAERAAEMAERKRTEGQAAGMVERKRAEGQAAGTEERKSAREQTEGEGDELETLLREFFA
ncbi:MAG: hypothetical protein J6C33_06825 [Lachnospiraceae bacterium]|nr:hypothetical protein [Lachnospiraceae bacterium]